MLENKIESTVRKHAIDTGWWTAKFTSPNQAHVPDRIFIKDKKTIFIEFKGTGRKLRKAQIHKIEQMRKHGAKIYVVDSIVDGKSVLDANSK